MPKTGHRLRKHDMKEDSFVTFAFRAQEYLRLHQRKLILGLSGLAIVAVGLFLFAAADRRAERSAEERLNVGFVRVQQNDMDGAAEVYRRLIDEFGGTVAAREALFYLANLYFVQERWEEARDAYERFAQAYGKGDPPRRAAAWAAAGDACQALGEQERAIQSYERALSVQGAGFLAADIYVQAARSALLAGDSAKATALADRLYERAGASPQMLKVRELLALHGVLYTRGF